MLYRLRRFAPAVLVGAGLCLVALARGQDASLSPPSDEPPPIPRGVEVLARGPVHEAYASLTAEPSPMPLIPRKPPKALEEVPPEEKPDGDVLWISGYWSYDEERKDFLWVSGIWRVPPPGKRWVAGYWREVEDQAQWVPGFWTTDEQQQDNQPQQVTYLPQPPATPVMASPGDPPTPDSFYVPGNWVWNGTTWAWQAGYWGHVQPGLVWVPSHYRWTPSGYIYIRGYWDLALSERGVMYAPVYVDPAVVTVGFVYSPGYVVRDTIVVDSLFVRPCCCHYYFGDYYGPAYHDCGYESCVVYSRSHYDAVFVYERYEHRDEPRWESIQIDICTARHEGRAPCPPRTLVQQNTIIQQNITNVTNVNNVTNVTNVNNVNNTNVTNVKNVSNVSNVLAPASQLSKVKNVSTVRLDPATRNQVKQQAQTVQQVAYERQKTEVASPGGPPKQPAVHTLSVPKTQPVAVKAPVSNTPASGTPPRKLGVSDATTRAAKPATNAQTTSFTKPTSGSATGSAVKAPAQPASGTASQGSGSVVGAQSHQTPTAPGGSAAGHTPVNAVTTPPNHGSGGAPTTGPGSVIGTHPATTPTSPGGSTGAQTPANGIGTSASHVGGSVAPAPGPFGSGGMPPSSGSISGGARPAMGSGSQPPGTRLQPGTRPQPQPQPKRPPPSNNHPDPNNPHAGS